MANVKTRKNVKKKKKTSRARKGFSLFLMFLIGVTLSYNVVSEIREAFSLSAQLNDASLSQEELNNRKEELTTQKENLNDTEYLIRYARAKYLATKEDGEQVFKLPEDESDSEE